MTTKPATEGLGNTRSVAVLVSYLLLYGVLANEWLGNAYARLPIDLFSDGWLIYWILDWVGDNLLSAPGRIFDPPINWPAANQLAGSEHFGAFQITYLPLRFVLGSELAAYNATIFLAYVLASWFTALVLKRLGCAPTIAWIGGLLYGPITSAFALPLRQLSTAEWTVAVRPALPHILQVSHLFVPWIVLALVRIRDRPDLVRAAHLSLALTVGFLSSYYMAVLLVLLASLWGFYELVRPAPQRLRFALLSAAAAGVACMLLLVISMPYFSRPEATGEADLIFSRWKTDQLVNSPEPQVPSRTAVAQSASFWSPTFWRVAARFQALRQADSFPTIRTLLALLAVAALLSGRSPLTRAASGGLLLFLAGITLSLPDVMTDLTQAQSGQAIVLETPLSSLLRNTSARFIRDPVRFSPIFVFGLVVLTCAGLESLRRLPSRIPFAVCMSLVVLFEIDRRWDPYPHFRAAFGLEATTALQEAGRWRLARFFEPILEENKTLTSHREAYEKIASILRQRGGGPLIELPARAHRAETLVGQRILEQPNIYFYTGYKPPHTRLVKKVAQALPNPFALQDLMLFTDLRWILIRMDSPQGEELAAELRSRVGIMRSVTELWEIDDFLLLELVDEPRNPDWVDAVRRGPQPGETILGTPRRPLSPDDLSFIVYTTRGEDAPLSAGGWATYIIHIGNSGVSLPAARPDRPEEQFSVRLRLDWQPLDKSQAVPEATFVPLRRDVPGASYFFQRVLVPAPKQMGVYDLTASLEQLDNPGAFANAGKVNSTRLFFDHCAPGTANHDRPGACDATAPPQTAKSDTAAAPSVPTPSPLP